MKKLAVMIALVVTAMVAAETQSTAQQARPGSSQSVLRSRSTAQPASYHAETVYYGGHHHGHGGSCHGCGVASCGGCGGGCGTCRVSPCCCPRIIPKLLDGIGNAIDRLFCCNPCRTRCKPKCGSFCGADCGCGGLGHDFYDPALDYSYQPSAVYQAPRPAVPQRRVSPALPQVPELEPIPDSASPEGQQLQLNSPAPISSTRGGSVRATTYEEPVTVVGKETTSSGRATVRDTAQPVGQAEVRLKVASDYQEAAPSRQASPNGGRGNPLR